MTSDLSFISDHTNMDYPVGVYYIDLSQMFMKHVDWHWHEELELDLVRSGSAIFHVGGNEETIEGGSAVLINGNHIHSIEPIGEKPCVIVSIMFHPGFLFGKKNSFLYNKYCAPLMDNPDFRMLAFSPATYHGKKCIESIQNILATNLNPQFGYELTTQNSLHEFWIQMLKENAPIKKSGSFSLQSADEERTKRGIEFLHDHYHETLTLDHIADAIHLSKSECCRCFKRAIGLSPFEYLMQYRIYASAIKMQRSNAEGTSFLELSEEVGFHNASYFNKIFKKYIGITPTKYRSEIKKNHRDALSPYGIPLSRM